MKLDESYSLAKHAAKVAKLIQENIGEGLYPSNKEVGDLWDAISNPLPPRTYMYILQTKGDSTFRSKGLSLLGLPDSWTFSAAQVLGLTHVNQRQLVGYQTFSLYETFIKYPELIKDKGVVYCTSRGVKNSATENDYWLVHQLGYPLQYDRSGYVTKYFCSFRIVGEYKGEALETQVFTDPEFPEEQKALREILSAVKQGMLTVLQFTKTERRIIELFNTNSKLTTKHVAELENSSQKTIRNHITSINGKAKAAFPLNNFRSIKDVVRYLQEQLII